MMRKILNMIGLDICYVCQWGVYSHRYDGIDAYAGRPIHGQMSVAPPWAKMRIFRRGA